MATVTQILKRGDGSEIKICATEMFGLGLTRSVDVYVHRRESSSHDWKLCGDKPHPNWRNMSVDEYVSHGRSEMLSVASSGEILKTVSLLGASS